MSPMRKGGLERWFKSVVDFELDEATRRNQQPENRHANGDGGFDGEAH